MRREIYCLQVGKGQLSPFIRERLFVASQQMLQTGIRKTCFQGDVIGYIQMEEGEANLGFMKGQIFSAEVRGEDTEFVGTYIVRPEDMHSAPGVWSPLTDLVCPNCGEIH